MDKVEFVKFGTKARDNHTYALDSKGVIWVSSDGVEWESMEAMPRYIKQGLNAGQIMQIMARRGTEII
jgi:hypothetical protein